MLKISPIILAVALGLTGWVGLTYLVSNLHPTLPMRVAFLALWAFAWTGTAFPVLLALHRRFRGEPSSWTVWRQSAWIGLLGLLSAWLQMNRVLNAATATILTGLFIVLEVILSLRARQESHND